MILSILAHLAHVAHSYFSLIVSAIKTYNCSRLIQTNKNPNESKIKSTESNGSKDIQTNDSSTLIAIYQQS